jgi:acyl-coenzyme A thioesterase PaaI-like protein
MTTPAALHDNANANANADPAEAPPPGFAPHSRHSPLTAPWEPIHARADGHAVQLGLRVREAHCNSRGFAHGGLVSALADNAMGLSAVATVRAAQLAADTKATSPRGAVTVSLTLDFLDSARIGDWLSIRPVVLKHGRTLAFTEAHVWASTGSDERLVARASATFRMG